MSEADTVLYQDPETPSHVVVDSAMTWEESMDSLPPACPPEIKNNQVLLDVRYLGFDGEAHAGQILINARLAEDLRIIFSFVLEIGFPVQSVIPLAEERFVKNDLWDDDISMSANNTSGFNFRTKTGGTTLSAHALGCAIDMNPLLNPYVKGETVLPSGALYDINREGTLYPDHPLVKKFKEYGWSWGGDWQTLKDYQHFEKVPEPIGGESKGNNSR